MQDPSYALHWEAHHVTAAIACHYVRYTMIPNYSVITMHVHWDNNGSPLGCPPSDDHFSKYVIPTLIPNEPVMTM